MTPRELLFLALGLTAGVAFAHYAAWCRGRARARQRATEQFKADTAVPPPAPPTDAERISGWRETAKVVPLRRVGS